LTAAPPPFADPSVEAASADDALAHEEERQTRLEAKSQKACRLKSLRNRKKALIGAPALASKQEAALQAFNNPYIALFEYVCAKKLYPITTNKPFPNHVDHNSSWHSQSLLKPS
jgi:hypothetical protein